MKKKKIKQKEQSLRQRIDANTNKVLKIIKINS